ncbi:hypothetical protein EEB14_48465 [Rhodococcus sp. WS4]|nr:hypothetical protein EEB14_48465 [Rhodococcus sp. WS4]
MNPVEDDTRSTSNSDAVDRDTTAAPTAPSAQALAIDLLPPLIVGAAGIVIAWITGFNVRGVAAAMVAVAGALAFLVENSILRRRRTGTTRGGRAQGIEGTEPLSRITASLLCLAPVTACAAVVAVQLWDQRADDRQLVESHNVVTQLASDATAALLSYTPETVDQNLTDASSLLTGDLLNSYRELARDVVGPTSKEKKVTMQAVPVGAAVESVSADKAKVLVYVNQTTTMADTPDPAQTQNVVHVALDRIDGQWLISGFDPLF